MHAYKLIAIFCSHFFLINLSAQNIAVADSLKMNSDELKVKMGSQGLGKIWKFKFGDYAVVSSKLGWEKSNSKSNLLGSRTESNSSQKFSFKLTGAGSDTADVNASTNIETKTINEVNLLKNFSVGENDLLLEKNSFSAFVILTNDTAETWTLLMNTFNGTQVPGYQKADAMFTNGERKMYLIPITSNDKRSSPAMGYELFENGNAIAALQYFGGGTFGMNKNIIWLKHDLDAKMKIRIAAALTAILQTKATNIGF